jgi:hypothetical protein
MKKSKISVAVIPAKAGIHVKPCLRLKDFFYAWIPAFAGMTPSSTLGSIT